MEEEVRELYEGELGWAEFCADVGADDSPEPYRSLVKEKDRLVLLRASIAQRQLTGGRAKWQLNEHAKKHATIRDDYHGIPAV